MKEIEKIMREILAICPDVKSHLSCLGVAIRKELDKKEEEKQLDLVELCNRNQDMPEKVIFTKEIMSLQEKDERAFKEILRK